MESNEKLCPACGGVLSPGAKFCPSCGTKLEEEVKPELTLENQPTIPEAEIPSPVLTTQPELPKEPVEEQNPKNEAPASPAPNTAWYTPSSTTPESPSAQPETTSAPTGKVCPNCQAPVSESALFCNRCGAPLNQQKEPEPKVCSYCGAPLEPGAVFCAHCGTQVPQETTTAPSGSEGFQQPYTAPTPEYRGAPIYPQKSNFGTISMVLGIVGILFALLLPIIAYPLGIIGIILGVKARKNNEPRSTAGLVLSIITLVVAAINSILGVLMALGSYYWYYY